MKSMCEFSIIVCTYNSAARIKETLRHISLLSYPKELVEVIIVDNNSNDSTSDVANKFWSELGAPFSCRIIFEGKQGLNHARKRGVIESKFDTIVFCDDDNWLSTNYLVVSDEIMSNQKDVGVLGGQGIPETNTLQFPNWFYSYAGSFATGVQSMKSGDISSRGFVWGAGSVMPRKLILSFLSSGLEFILSGRSGNVLAAGDDSEMCKWFLIAGYKLWYEEKLLFHHFIPNGRLSIEYLEKMHEGFTLSRPILDLYDLYLTVKITRKSWNSKPLTWLLSELRFFVNRNPYKASVIKNAKHIEQLACC